MRRECQLVNPIKVEIRKNTRKARKNVRFVLGTKELLVCAEVHADGLLLSLRFRRTNHDTPAKQGDEDRKI